jgi:hypothetical protein
MMQQLLLNKPAHQHVCLKGHTYRSCLELNTTCLSTCRRRSFTTVFEHSCLMYINPGSYIIPRGYLAGRLSTPMTS